jgi:hypothetical protein
MRTIKPINRNTPKLRAARRKLQVVLARFFRKEGPKVAQQVARLYKEQVGDLRLVDYGPSLLTKLKDPRVKRILDDLDLSGFSVLATEVGDILQDVALDGVAKAVLQIGLRGDAVTDQMSEAALEYAEERGAELVGMKWVDGKLVDNPNAEWAISETTRDYLRADIAEAIFDGRSSQDLAEIIVDNYAFSDSRAMMVARTEIAFAHSEGNMIAYKESGLVEGKRWILGSEHDDDDECDRNADEGVIPLNQPFQSGDEAAPAHPN